MNQWVTCLENIIEKSYPNMNNDFNFTKAESTEFYLHSTSYLLYNLVPPKIMSSLRTGGSDGWNLRWKYSDHPLPPCPGYINNSITITMDLAITVLICLFCSKTTGPSYYSRSSWLFCFWWSIAMSCLDTTQHNSHIWLIINSLLLPVGQEVCFTSTSCTSGWVSVNHKWQLFKIK